MSTSEAPGVLRISSVKGKPAKTVCSTSTHTVILTTDGTVYSRDVNATVTDHADRDFHRFEFPPSSYQLKPEIISICSGRYHCLALTSRRRLYSWGRNSFGQLGINNSTEQRKRPKAKFVEALSCYDVIQIACGDNHCLARTKDGRLFAWGAYEEGQLGVGSPTGVRHHIATPTQIDKLQHVTITHIAAGGAHSVALSDSDGVFVWGANDFGQLGIRHRGGKKRKTEKRLPVRLETMSREEISEISCGENHTSFLTKSGDVYVYGMGVTRHVSARYPSELTPGRLSGSHLFSQICSAGDSTFLCERRSERIFHLNHRLEPESQLLPNALEMSVSEILDRQPLAQLNQDCSCEVHYRDIGVVKTKAQGDLTDSKILQGIENVCTCTCGQDGGSTGSATNIASTSTTAVTAAAAAATAVNDVTAAAAVYDGESEAKRVHRGKHAVHPTVRPKLEGSNRQWVGCLCAGHDHLFIIDHVGPQWILPLLVDLLTLLRDSNVDVTIATDKIESIRQLSLSSSKSSLQTGYRSNDDEDDELELELESAMKALEAIDQNVNLLERLSVKIGKELKTAHIRARTLQYYISLMECPIFSRPQCAWCRRLLETFGALFLKTATLWKHEHRSPGLVEWWKSDPMVFRRFITAYIEALSVLIYGDLQSESKNASTYLRVLGALNEVNIVHDIVTVKSFYIPDLDQHVDSEVIFESLRGMLEFKCKNIDLLSYPFLIDIETKARLLKFDHKVLQKQRVDHLQQMMESQMVFNPLLWLTGFQMPTFSLNLYVNRNDIFGQSVEHQLSMFLRMKRSELERPLGVIFEGELGIDEGMLTKEFFRLVFQELFDPEKMKMHGIFRLIDEHDPRQSPVWFREDLVKLDLARICGLLFGLALYNQGLVPLPFPQLFYAKLLGKGPKSEMEEIAELDPEFADQMTQLQNGTEEYVRTSCLGIEVQLEDGQKVEVTEDNVHLYVKQRVRSALAPAQFAAFQEGFSKVYNPRILRIFRPIEFENLVAGEKHLDWKALERSTRYQDPYTASHNTIKMFWEVFHKLDDKRKREFLVFIAGSNRVPVGGLGKLGLTIAHLPVQPEDDLDEQTALSLLCPVAHGCDRNQYERTLRLPMYTSVANIKDRLLFALSCYQCPFHIA